MGENITAIKAIPWPAIGKIKAKIAYVIPARIK